MNVQMSDVGSLNLTGRYSTDGFGGLEETVMQRSTNTESSYSVTANLELGKFFPDKAKVSAPLYYSVTSEESRPRYNPLDSDIRLAVTAGIRRVFAEKPEAFDPREYLKVGREEVKKMVLHKIYNVLGSANTID